VVSVMTGSFVVAMKTVRLARALSLLVRWAMVNRGGRWKPERLAATSEANRGWYGDMELPASTPWPRSAGGCLD
jgi:hypothetical protein